MSRKIFDFLTNVSPMSQRLPKFIPTSHGSARWSTKKGFALLRHVCVLGKLSTLTFHLNSLAPIFTEYPHAIPERIITYKMKELSLCFL